MNRRFTTIGLAVFLSLLVSFAVPTGSVNANNDCYCETRTCHTDSNHGPYAFEETLTSPLDTANDCCTVCVTGAPHKIKIGPVGDVGAATEAVCPPKTPDPCAIPGTEGTAVPPPTVYRLTNPLGAANLQELIGNIIRSVLGIIGSIALVVFIYGGFLWLTSGGNPEKINTGKSTMVWGTIGLAVILFAYTLVQFVFQALGI